MYVYMYVCMYVFLLFIDINSMPHYTVTLHALHKIRFSFTITFTVNNHKTIDEIHDNFDNNIFLTLNLQLIILTYTLCDLSIFYSKVSLQICKVYGYTHIHTQTYTHTYIFLPPPMDP